MLPHLDLQIDISGSLEEGLGSDRGVSPETLADGLRQADEIVKGIWDLRRLGQVPFLDLPYQEATLEQILSLADQRRGAYQDVVVCGFGGSALGSAMLVEGIQRSTRNLGDPHHPRLHILDTLDPATIDAVWDLIDPSQTLFIFNSQSGKTIETLIQFELFYHRLKTILGSAGLRDHMFVMTRKGQSPLGSRAESEKIPVMAVPQGVGGRFSVLTAAHLFPAALCDVDILSLIQGAKRMDERVGPGSASNPAAQLAALLFLWAERRRHRSVVIWPYVDRLSSFGSWISQLMAESLGKKFSLKEKEVRAGLTPILASGVATQHSELQLYLDGPLDKVFLFVTSSPSVGEPLQSSLPLVSGQSVGAWLMASELATEQTMAQQGIPSLKIELPEVTEYCLGQLIFMSEVLVAILGGLMEINPYDQPGVESVKRKLLQSFTV